MSELPYDEGDFITLTGTVGKTGTGYDLPTFTKGANFDGRVSDYTLYVESIDSVSTISGLDSPKRIVTVRKPDGSVTEVTANVRRSHTVSQKNSQGYQTHWEFEVSDE